VETVRINKMSIENMVEVEFGACTDVGRARENNEDSFRVASDIGLFVLSDGMGGQSSGEVASRLATDTVIAHCREAYANPSLPLIGQTLDGVSEAGNRLASAIRLANSAVHDVSQEHDNLRGMGATVVAVMLSEERVSIAHAGDSRVYRFRNGKLERLTQDHSFIEEQVRRGLMTPQEASSSTLQNVLMRAVGVDVEIDVEVNEELFADDDVLLLCSDGLTKELSDAQIANVLAENEDPEMTAEQLIDLANQAGGSDNVTAIVLRHMPRLVGAFERLGRWLKRS
jgi:PPM family protein phosphatase